MTWMNLLAVGIDRLRDEPHSDIADDMARELLDQQGEPWADAIIVTAVRDHCREALNKAHKELTSFTVITRAGRQRKVNSSAVQRVRDKASGDIIGVQRHDWWDYDLAQMDALLDETLRSRQEITERVDLYRAVRDSLARHPECTTAREAWLADGRDLAEIDLSA